LRQAIAAKGALAVIPNNPSRALKYPLDKHLALVRAFDAAQHPEDLAFDLRPLVVVARRLLSGGEAAASSAVGAFAIELLSDLAIAPPGDGGPRLPNLIDLPFDAGSQACS
jgi:hypothetical protein